LIILPVIKNERAKSRVWETINSSEPFSVPMTEIKVGDVLCEGTEKKTSSVVVTAGGDPDGFQFSTVNEDGSEGPFMRTLLGTTPGQGFNP
jgi:hypothetical protein